MTANGIIDGARAQAPLRERTQVVVIGSGAGGANVALRLVEQGIRVILLELGDQYRPEDFSQEPAAATTMLWREFGMRMASGDTHFPVPGANALGGSTVINAGICFRPPEHMVRLWHDEHGAEWATADRLNPVVDWVWETMAVRPVPEPFLGNHNLAARDAFAAMGWQYGVIDRNAPGCVGCGVCYFGCPSGGKRSVDKAQIPAAIELGLRVITRARCDRILVDGGRATGVEGVLLDRSGRNRRTTFHIDADAIVASCGGIDTPILLQESGLANIDDGVGAQFHVHPGTGCVAILPDRETEIWRGVPQGIYSDQFVEDGYLFESSNLPASAFFTLGVRAGENPDKWMKLYRHIALAGGMIRDESPATVTRDALGKSSVKMHFTDRDLRKAVEAMRNVGRAYFAIGASAVLPSIAGVGLLRSPQELDRALARVRSAADLDLYGSHPQSTVPFHHDPKRAPLRPDFALHRYPNVFVADASVFPVALGVNPQITIMALGRIAGDYVAAAL